MMLFAAVNVSALARLYAKPVAIVMSPFCPALKPVVVWTLTLPTPKAVLMVAHVNTDPDAVG